MKRIDDIEKMSLSELVDEASKVQVEVPADLEDGINRKIGRNIWIHKGYRFMAAASMAAVLAVGLTFTSPKVQDNFAALRGGSSVELVDTFDDPALAYAEVERALSKFSNALNSGADQARQSEQMLNEQKQFVKNIAR